jgi:hypothetical protein
MKHVYGMTRDDGAVKIGISHDPHARKVYVKHEIRQPVSVSFQIPKRSDARAVEVIAHKLLADQHDVGEWFWVSVEDAMAAVSLAVDIVEGRSLDVTAGVPDPTRRFLRIRPKKDRKAVVTHDPTIRALAKKVAAAERRSITSIIEVAILEYAAKRGLRPDKETTNE